VVADELREAGERHQAVDANESSPQYYAAVILDSYAETE
jgi:hypothetical protein